MPLKNSEVETHLKWSKNCVLIEECDDIIGIIFAITSTELYVPVVTFFIDDNIKFSKIIKQGFKRTTSLNKYTPEITTQSKNNN